MHMRKPNILIAFGVVVVVLLGAVSAADQGLLQSPDSVPAYEPKFYPYAEGEKAVYKATWNGMIAVATAEVHTTPTVVDGKQVYHVRVEARTSKALDFIWKMRDTIRSTFDAKALLP